MVACFTMIVRTLLIATVLGFLSQPALAGRGATGPTAAAHHAAHAEPADETAGDDLPLDGLLIIAGVVALLVFVAWLGSRIGDDDSHVMG